MLLETSRGGRIGFGFTVDFVAREPEVAGGDCNSREYGADRWNLGQPLHHAVWPRSSNAACENRQAPRRPV